jgi:hypothetical protein
MHVNAERERTEAERGKKEQTEGEKRRKKKARGRISLLFPSFFALVFHQREEGAK